jgi:hypothetical protein
MAYYNSEKTLQLNASKMAQKSTNTCSKHVLDRHPYPRGIFYCSQKSIKLLHATAHVVIF